MSACLWSADEIWSILERCSRGDTDVLFDAFYPEFYEALIQYTAEYAVMAKLKEELILSRKLTKGEIQLALDSHPVFGMIANVAYHPLFNYELFFSYFEEPVVKAGVILLPQPKAEELAAA